MPIHPNVDPNPHMTYILLGFYLCQDNAVGGVQKDDRYINYMTYL